MKIAVGTKNKAKIGAVEAVLKELYPTIEIITYDAASDVSEQPLSSTETRQGAINRAKNTMKALQVDLSFGLEGGVEQIEDQLYCCNWGAVHTKEGHTYAVAGAQFLLAPEVADAVLAGEELGPVMDRFTKTKDIRQHAGAVGVFTNDLINRKEMFEHIVKLLIGQVQYFENVYK